MYKRFMYYISREFRLSSVTWNSTDTADLIDRKFCAAKATREENVLCMTGRQKSPKDK